MYIYLHIIIHIYIYLHSAQTNPLAPHILCHTHSHNTPTHAPMSTNIPTLILSHCIPLSPPTPATGSLLFMYIFKCVYRYLYG